MKPCHLIFFLLVFVSCETIVDVEVPRKAPKLVMNATVRPGWGFLIVRISQSQYILDDTEYRRVNNAAVSLFEEGVFIEQLEKSERIDGMYVIFHSFNADKTYTLKAEAPGFAPVEATTSFRQPVPIQTVTLDTVHAENNGFCLNSPCPIPVKYKVNLTFQDAANTYNYYSVVAFVRKIDKNSGSISSSDDELFLFSEDVSLALSEFSLEGKGYQGYELWFSDDIFDGQDYTFSFEIEEGDYDVEDSLELYVKLRHQSEANFKYQVSRELQSWNEGNPFAEPVLVYNNIENGYGIFASYNETIKKVVP